MTRSIYLYHPVRIELPLQVRIEFVDGVEQQHTEKTVKCREPPLETFTIGITDGFFWPVSTRPERKKIDFWPTMEDRGGSKWSHLPITRTAQQYMDTWRRTTPRGQLGFPKTHGELLEVKEFSDGQVFKVVSTTLNVLMINR